MLHISSATYGNQVWSEPELKETLGVGERVNSANVVEGNEGVRLHMKLTYTTYSSPARFIYVFLHIGNLVILELLALCCSVW